MIAELFFIFTLVVFGCCFVRYLGFNGLYTPFIGYLTGIASYVTLGFFQVLVGINTNPKITLGTLIFLTFIILIYDHSTEKLIRFSLKSILITLSCIAILVVLFWHARIFNWHIDSFFNMEVGSLLATNNYDVASLGRIEKRLLALPFIHASSHLGGVDYYVRSFTPLLSISIAASIGWIAWEGLRKKVNRKILAKTILAGLILMITANRYIFHSFYINGHLLFAALLLMICGFSWLTSMNRIYEKKNTAYIIIICLSLPALVVTRPEGSLVAALALLPLFFNPILSWHKRVLPLLSLGFSMTAWQTFVALKQYEQTGQVNNASSALLFVGVSLILVIPLLKWKFLVKNQKKIVLLVESLMWSALITFTLLRPALQIQSMYATIQNVVFGSWGWSLLVIGVSVILSLALIKTPQQTYLRFPVTTFVILGFLLAYLRDGAYRIGNGDSFNRMLIQIVPLAILYIIIAVAAGTPKPWVVKIRNVVFNKLKRTE